MFKCVDKAHNAFQQEEKAVNKINALLYPGEGSLLEFLRANVDDWELSLGKVVRPELLERADLAPAMAKDAQGESHTFMGVKLALTELDTPDYAFTEQALKQQLQKLKFVKPLPLLRKTNANSAGESERRCTQRQLVVTQRQRR